MEVFKKQAHFFKGALLAGGINAHQNLGGGKDGRETVHGRMKLHYAPGRRNISAPKKRPHGDPGGLGQQVNSGLHQSFGRLVLVFLHFVFVPHDLAVELVDQFINRRIQVFVRTLGKQVAAFDMNIAFGTLSFFLFFLLLHGEQHFDIYNLVKMPGNSIELGGHIGTQCRGDFEVVTADRQVHEEPPVALGVKKTVCSANG
jgi:hypothetical protein